MSFILSLHEKGSVNLHKNVRFIKTCYQYLQVGTACSEILSTGTCSISNIAFSEAANSEVNATFTLSITDGESATENVTDVFNELVRKAADGTLMADNTVKASSVQLGPCELFSYIYIYMKITSPSILNYAAYLNELVLKTFRNI